MGGARVQSREPLTRHSIRLKQQPGSQRLTPVIPAASLGRESDVARGLALRMDHGSQLACQTTDLKQICGRVPLGDPPQLRL